MPSRVEPTPFPDDHGVFGVPGDMSPWDVRFDPADRAHLDDIGGGVGLFRVWAEPTLTDGHLVVRTGVDVVAYPMAVISAGGRFDFWEIEAGPLPEQTRYSFAFKTPQGTGVYLSPGGVTNAIERLDRWALTLPEPMTIPGWAEGVVIYQIFPDRFARSGVADPGDLEPWDNDPTPTGFKGGDLAGITERLDHLTALGIDVLYLNPIFAAPSNHRFDTVDYFNVDPLLGGNAGLRDLVSEAHDVGLRVVLDASFNHVHPSFFAFADVMERGPDSEYWSWFVVERWPLEIGYRQHFVDDDDRRRLQRWHEEIGLPLRELDGPGRAVEPSYEAWYGVATMPRVDLSHPAARAYMLDVAAYWVREFEIDGWRMDVARYVDRDFWLVFRKVVRDVDPDAYLLAEVWGDASDWLQGDMFDGTMNYTFRELALRFFATEEIDAAQLADGCARLWAQYAWPVTLANHNLLGSHDRARFLTEAGGEVWRARLAAVFQMTFPGAPGIYYGDEVGMEGGDDPHCRGAFTWDSGRHERSLLETYVELGRLRRTEPALVKGRWRPETNGDGVIAYSRELDGRRLVVVINRSPGEQRVEVTGCSAILWGEAVLDDAEVVVPPRSAGVLA